VKSVKVGNQWFVYLLRCNDGTNYCGMTADLRHRISEHKKGQVRSTASRLPVELVWYHIFRTGAQARRKELSLKNGKTRKKTIQQMISLFPKEALAPFA